AELIPMTEIHRTSTQFNHCRIPQYVNPGLIVQIMRGEKIPVPFNKKNLNPLRSQILQFIQKRRIVLFNKTGIIDPVMKNISHQKKTKCIAGNLTEEQINLF